MLIQKVVKAFGASVERKFCEIIRTNMTLRVRLIMNNMSRGKVLHSRPPSGGIAASANIMASITAAISATLITRGSEQSGRNPISA